MTAIFEESNGRQYDFEIRSDVSNSECQRRLMAADSADTIWEVAGILRRITVFHKAPSNYSRDCKVEFVGTFNEKTAQ